MNRIYHHYSEWEDYQNGLYNLNEVENMDSLILNCANLLKNCEEFYSVMLKVIKHWRKAAEVNLTNTNRNRQAWLGQSSCCYKFKAPEYITKIAWRTLSKVEQDKANKTADRIILEWETKYINGNEQLRLISYA